VEDKEEEYLGNFLGPKSENAKILEDILLIILRDYIHWRKNYFPGDEILINRELQKNFDYSNEILYEKVHKMMALLKRNFPFYSPRYIGHMLSDVAMPSMIGYMAGMLFNPNNVTPEAAPVTTHMEIEACNEILKMIGYTPPPQPTLDQEKIKQYDTKLKKKYGWAHITPGGTISNIEALWIARAVKYFPLAVKKVVEFIENNGSFTKKIRDIRVKIGSSEEKNIKDISDEELLLLKPEISIYLMEKYVEAVKSTYNYEASEAHKKAWELINMSGYTIAEISRNYQPLIFVSGTAHYSIRKAADISGIGQENIIQVKMDSQFRIDIQDLKEKIIKHTYINDSSKPKKIPLMVVAIVGTTEEGSVDPVDQIIELRNELENKKGISFWIHIDAAWGGYIASLFNIEKKDFVTMKIGKIIRQIRINIDQSSGNDLAYLNDELFKGLREKFYENSNLIEVNGNLKFKNEFKNEVIQSLNEFLPIKSAESKSTDKYELAYLNLNLLKRKLGKSSKLINRIVRIVGILYKKEAKNKEISFYDFMSRERNGNFEALVSKLEEKYVDEYNCDVRNLNSLGESLNQQIKHNKYDEYFENLKKTIDSGLVKRYYQTSLAWDPSVSNDIIFEELKNYVKEDINLKLRIKNKLVNIKKTIKWADPKVYNSFIEMRDADSVTIDPHKMGYLQYPNGAVAFKNDRVRYFIWQNAPYITSSDITHYQPPKHVIADNLGNKKISISAFAPFILEGSRPGAAACALWLSTQMMPLTMKKHGSIIRASLLATRWLYEALIGANKVLSEIGGYDFEFIPLTSIKIGSDIQPICGDTNIIVFVIRRKNNHSISVMNNLTNNVYEEFTILEELGEREYSYSQQFFLSKTKFSKPDYPFSTLENFFKMSGITSSKEAAMEEYKKEGLTVIRATVMNPYLFAIEKSTGQSLIDEFILKLINVAERETKKLC